MIADDTPLRPNRGLFYLSLAVALCTLPLVFVGGAVTSKNAGLSVPDWPLSYGSLNPPHIWEIDSTRTEHGHRVLGASVGILVIALMIFTLLTDSRRWVKRFSIAILGAVIVQGVLGGLRVTEISTGLAVVHGITGQIFFCMTASMALFCSRRWKTAPAAIESADAAAVQRQCIVVMVAVLGQVILGACYRHLGSLLLLHIFGALVVTGLSAALTLRILAGHKPLKLLTIPVHILAALVVFELMVGPFAWFLTAGYNDDRTATLAEWLVPTVHQVLGALALMSAVLTTLGAYRCLKVGPANTTEIAGESTSA